MNLPAPSTGSASQVFLPKETTYATRPVDLVILGANFGAKIARQIAAAETPAVRVAGVSDLDTAKARTLANELGVPHYPSLEAILRDPATEAVGVFTGPSGRGRLLEKILDAGKHVMTTKPFELETAGLRGRVAQRPCAPPELALPLPRRGPRPDPRLVGRSGPGSRAVSFHARTWADYREQADGSWLDDPLRCPGGPLFRLGVYFLNDFAGLPGRPVAVRVSHSRIRTGRPTPDNAQMSITYDNGAVGNIFASFCVGDEQPYRDEVVIACERGTIRRWMERRGGDAMDQDHAVVELQRAGRPVERLVTAPGDYAGWYQWSAFHDAVRGRPGAIAYDAASTISGVRLLAALTKAAQSPADVVV